MRGESQPWGGEPQRRIAVVAPPWYPLPPHGYGGIELVVTLLVRELRARGHSVLVFGAEGSDLGTIACAPRGWGAHLGQLSGSARELTYLARVCRRLRSAGPLDVIHDHSGFAGLLTTSLLDVERDPRLTAAARTGTGHDDLRQE
jgi:hypothetical protein